MNPDSLFKDNRFAVYHTVDKLTLPNEIDRERYGYHSVHDHLTNHILKGKFPVIKRTSKLQHPDREDYWSEGFVFTPQEFMDFLLLWDIMTLDQRVPFMRELAHRERGKQFKDLMTETESKIIRYE